MAGSDNGWSFCYQSVLQQQALFIGPIESHLEIIKLIARNKTQFQGQPILPMVVIDMNCAVLTSYLRGVGRVEMGHNSTEQPA